MNPAINGWAIFKANQAQTNVDGSHQFLRNLLVEDFLHRQGDDDFVAAIEMSRSDAGN